jgi:hypothetical protein
VGAHVRGYHSPGQRLIVPMNDRMLAILHNEIFSRWFGEEADPR